MNFYTNLPHLKQFVFLLIYLFNTSMTNPQYNLRELLLKGNSRSYTDFIADIVTKRTDLVEELWGIYFALEEPVSRRAAWIIDTASENRPEWSEPYLAQLVTKLPLMNHDGLKRHAFRIISRMPFPEGTEGEIMNIAFDWLISASESVAVKMYSMLILYRLSAKEPDILQELYDTIEFQLADGTPGFKGIGRKMMEQIDQDIIKRKLGGK